MEIKIKKQIFFIIIGTILLISIASASFGLDNTDIPSLRLATSTGNTTNNYYNGTGITNISEAGDVDYTGVANGEVLTWSSSVMKWINSAAGSASKWIFGDSSYWSNDSTTVYFNETFLNETIDARATGGNNSFNQTLTDTLYSKDLSTINLSESSFTGNITNGSLIGYDAVNAICNFEDKGHACSESEISEAIYLDIYPTSGVGWVIAGGPKYAPADHPVSDCSGFTIETTRSTDPLGNFWSFDSNGGKGIAGNCGLSYPIICCK